MPLNVIAHVNSDASIQIAAINDSPKPPPERVTFTLPLVNAARNVAFVATGEAKKEVLFNILEVPSS